MNHRLILPMRTGSQPYISPIYNSPISPNLLRDKSTSGLNLLQDKNKNGMTNLRKLEKRKNWETFPDL